MLGYTLGYFIRKSLVADMKNRLIRNMEKSEENVSHVRNQIHSCCQFLTIRKLPWLI